MRTLSADWMANTTKPESEMQSLQPGGEESQGNYFYPRPVAPTAAQVLLLKFVLFLFQFLVTCSRRNLSFILC